MTEMTSEARKAEKASGKADLVLRQCQGCYSEILDVRERDGEITCGDHA